MRFNDGFWLLKSGIKPFHGLQVVQGLQDGDGYNFQVSTKPIRHRGDTLAGTRRVPSIHPLPGLILSTTGPVLSVRVHSPTEGVIGIKIEHFKHIESDPVYERLGRLFKANPPSEDAYVFLENGPHDEVGKEEYTDTPAPEFRNPKD